MSPVLKGVGVGLLVAVALGLVVAPLTYRLFVQQKTEGWNAVPVMVAKQDLPAGTIVPVTAVSQRGLPERFVTASNVKPDSLSYIINQKILDSADQGQPLLWNEFEGAGSGCPGSARDTALRTGMTPAVTQVINAVEAHAPAKSPR